MNGSVTVGTIYLPHLTRNAVSIVSPPVVLRGLVPFFVQQLPGGFPSTLKVAAVHTVLPAIEFELSHMAMHRSKLATNAEARFDPSLSKPQCFLYAY